MLGVVVVGGGVVYYDDDDVEEDMGGVFARLLFLQQGRHHILLILDVLKCHRIVDPVSTMSAGGDCEVIDAKGNGKLSISISPIGGTTSSVV